jgi:hypothetical protein
MLNARPNSVDDPHSPSETTFWRGFPRTNAGTNKQEV